MNLKKVLLGVSAFLILGLFAINSIDYYNVNSNLTSYADNKDNSADFEILETENNTCCITHYYGSSSDIIIPKTIVIETYDDDGYPIVKTLTVTSIDLSGEESKVREKIKSVNIPNTVKIIQKNAFNLFLNLDTITFEENSQLEIIDDYAFFRTSIKSITLDSKKLSKIGNKSLGYGVDGNIIKDFNINCYSYNKDIISNFTNNICINVLDENNVKYNEVSVTLDGNIGLNFLMDFNQSVLNDEMAKLVFYSNDGSINIEIPKTQWILDDKLKKYIFTIYISPKDMDNLINVDLYTSNNITNVTQHSVNSCIDEIIDTSNNRDLIELVQCVRNYGTCSKIYLNGGKISEKDRLDIDNIFNTDNLTDYAYTSIANINGISYENSSLVLKSGITLKHYFSISKDFNQNYYNFSIYKSSDGSIIPIKVTVSNDICIVSIEDINAYNLDDFYILEIEDLNSNDKYTLEYSPLSYANLILQQSDTSQIENLDTLKYLMKSLYLYNKSIHKYSNE